VVKAAAKGPARMAFLFRWLMRASVALAAMALTGAGLAYYLAS
jgi:hypothetical protein